MKIKTFCLFLFIFQAFCSDPEQKTNDKNVYSIGKNVQATASVLGSPEIANVISVLKSLKTESSTTMSERHKQEGFASLRNIYDYSYGAIYYSNIEKLVELWLEDNIFDYLSHVHKKILINSLKEYALQFVSIEDKYHKQKFELVFNNGKGSLFFLMLTLSAHPSNSSALKWEKYIVWSEFEPAPPYVVVTKSKCNIVSCKRSDEIVYLPATITDTHIQSIVKLNLDMVMNWQNNLIATK